MHQSAAEEGDLILIDSDDDEDVDVSEHKSAHHRTPVVSSGPPVPRSVLPRVPAPVRRSSATRGGEADDCKEERKEPPHRGAASPRGHAGGRASSSVRSGSSSPSSLPLSRGGASPLSSPSAPAKDLDYDGSKLTLCWQGLEDSAQHSDTVTIDRTSCIDWHQLLGNIGRAFQTSLPLYLSDSHLQPVEQTTWSSDYQRVSTLLVFLEPSRTVYRAYKKEVEHIPHFHLVTHAPEYRQALSDGHPALAFALGEFVDNALTAFRARRERNGSVVRGSVSIDFLEPSDPYAINKHMAILISDNGCGMDEATLKSFARMADAPHSRGIVRGSVLSDESNHYVNCSISQFGIGAKSAAFFVGESLSVSTYTGEVAAQVYEICLSERKMQTRYNATGNAYRSELSARPLAAPHQCAWLSESVEHQQHRVELEKEIRTKERPGEPFSRFLITGVIDELHAAIRDRFALVRAVADMYDRIVHGPYGQGAENDALNARAEWYAPELSLRYVNQGVVKWAVDDIRRVVDNDMTVYSRLRKGNIFRCAVEVPAPATEGAAESGTDKRARVRVEVRYFPRALDGETHPDLKRAAELEEALAEDGERSPSPRPRGRGGRGAAASRPLADEPGGGNPTTIAAHIATLRSRRSMCSLFWHGRQIPLATTGPLYFMTAQSPEYRDCIDRMQVNLFFSAPILTDRVKLHFRQDMGELLNRESDSQGRWQKFEFTVDDSGQSRPVPRGKSLKELFTKQIKEWALLDANYQFQQVNFLPQLSYKEEFALFKQVSLGGSVSAGKSGAVKAGDLVKVALRGVSKGEVFLRVLCVRREQKTADYEKDPKPEWSRGSVIGYIEPKELENIPPEHHYICRDAASLPKLFDLLRSSLRLSALDVQLAAVKMRNYSLRSILKDLPASELKKQYEEHVRRARMLYPHSISVHLTPKELLEDGSVLQFRVKGHFPASAVVAWAKGDNGRQPKPVAGEKVRQTFWTIVSPKHAPGAVEEEKAPKRRAGAGQLGRRVRKIRRVEESVDMDIGDEKDVAPAVVERYSSSGRPLVSRVNSHNGTLIIGQSAAAQSLRKKGRREAEEEKAHKKRRLATPGRPDVDDANTDDDVEEEEESKNGRMVSSSRASRPPAAAVEREIWGVPFDAEVCSVEHAQVVASPDPNVRNMTSRSINGFKDKRFDKVGRYQVEYALLKKAVDGDRDHVPSITATMEVFPAVPSTFVPLNPHVQLDMKLGKPAAAGLSLRAVDAYGNHITPASMRGFKGVAMDCPFDITCDEFPRLRITADPVLHANVHTDNYVLSNIKVEPTDDDLQTLTFADPRRGRKLPCHVTFKTVDNGESAIPFVVCLRPGEAQQLDTKSFPPDCQLTNTDHFPTFSLQLRDAFGQPTGIDADPVQQPVAFPLVSVWVDDPNLPAWAEGCIPPQRLDVNGYLHSSSFNLPIVYIAPEDLTREILKLDNASHGREDHYPFTVKLRCVDELADSADTKEEVRECLVSLLPRQFPSYILIYDPTAKGHIDYEPEFLLPPNAEVPLALKCVDDSGGGWGIDDDVGDNGEVFEGWRSWLAPALRKAIKVVVVGLLDDVGYPYETALNSLDGDRIPRLRMPKRVSSKVLQCEVRIELDESRLHRKDDEPSEEERVQRAKETDQLRYLRSRLPFVKAFNVRVQFGSAVRWNAELQPPVIKCAAQWGHKVKLFAVDRWGNKVATPDGLGKPRVRVQAVLTEADSLPSEQSARRAVMDEEKKDGAGDDDGSLDVHAVQLKHADEARIEAWATEDSIASPANVNDDDVALAEWDHFLYPKAFILMRAGPAILSVSDEAGKLLPSEDIPFLVEVGQAKRVRAHIRDKVTGQRTRLRDGLVLPARLMFDQLFVSWYDRAWNPAEPNVRPPNKLVLKIENAALFTEDENNAMQRRQYLEAVDPPVQADGGSVFPPFLSIYSRTADDADMEEKADSRAQSQPLTTDAVADDLANATMSLRVGLWDGEQAQTALCSISLRCCMLPYSINSLTVTSLFPHRSANEIERHRGLLSESALADLSRDVDSVEIAGTPAPLIDVQLHAQPNDSSLLYTLPPPSASSLSLEWRLNGQPTQLAYHPAVLDEERGVYSFRPLMEDDGKAVERKEGEGDVVRRGVMDKAGLWSYRVLYRELRPPLAKVLAEPTKELTVEERILPSYPSTLRILRDGQRDSNALPVVGNTGSRTIATHLRLVIVDAFDDVVFFPLISPALLDAFQHVVSEVLPVDDSSVGRARFPPSVVMSGVQADQEHHCVQIGELRVVDGNDSMPADVGQYAVVFRLPEPFADFSAALRFFFSPVERLLEERRKEEQRRHDERQALERQAREAGDRARQLRTAILPLQQRLSEWYAAASRIRVQEESVVQTVAALEQDAGLFLQLDGLRDALHHYRLTSRTSSDLAHPFAILEPQLVEAQSMLRDCYVRVEPVLRSAIPALDFAVIDQAGHRLTLAEHGYYGQLAPFLSVEDDRLCRLVSWFYARELEYHIATSRNSPAVQVLNANGRGHRLTIMYEEGLGPRPHPRPLPHTRLPLAVQSAVTGNPRYVHEVLHVHADSPQVHALISHVTSLIVQDTLTVTSMEDATRYRQLLSQHGFPCPTILALAEMKSLSALNVERWGQDSSAPALASLPTRVGVETRQVREWSGRAEEAQAKAVRVRLDADELMRQWREGGWQEQVDRLKRDLEAAQRQQRESEEQLRGLGENVPVPSFSLPSVPQQRNEHRRRQPMQQPMQPMQLIASDPNAQLSRIVL